MVKMIIDILFENILLILPLLWCLAYLTMHGYRNIQDGGLRNDFLYLENMLDHGSIPAVVQHTFQLLSGAGKNSDVTPETSLALGRNSF